MSYALQRLSPSLATFVLLLLVALPVGAQYPVKPIRLVIHFPAGGIVDLLARSIAQPLSQALGQPVVVENKPGADGMIADDAVAKAAPDGYTLLLGNMVPVQILHKNPPFNPETSFTPIALVSEFSGALVAHPGVPAKTLKELIDYAHAHPGKLSYATAAVVPRFAAEELKSSAKLDMVYVPYKGEAQVIPDLLQGRVQLMFAAAVNLVAPHVKEGRLHALATTTDARSSLLPGVLTMVELGLPRIAASAFVGLFGPAKLPKDIVDRLSREVNIILKRPDVRDQMEKNSIIPKGSTPDELAAYAREQTVLWQSMALKLGIKPE